MQGTRRLAGSAQQRARTEGNPRRAGCRHAGPKAISPDLSKREQECSVRPHLLAIGLLAGQQPKPAPWYMLPTRTSPAKRYLRAARIPWQDIQIERAPDAKWSSARWRCFLRP